MVSLSKLAALDGLRPMKFRNDFDVVADKLIRRIEEAGFAVSVHHMGQYVKLHAVHLSGDHIPHVARCAGDGEAETYQAARALAAMVGVSG